MNKIIKYYKLRKKLFNYNIEKDSFIFNKIYSENNKNEIIQIIKEKNYYLIVFLNAPFLYKTEKLNDLKKYLKNNNFNKIFIEKKQKSIINIMIKK